jgi:hypothetical protein
MAWSEVALVLAGSAGPLFITVLNNRVARQQQTDVWRREDTVATTDLYAEFIATATQVVADWSDYATLPPDTEEEERKLGEARDRTYADLNLVAAKVRLTAPPYLMDKAEAVLAEVRNAADVARRAQRGGCTPEDWVDLQKDYAAARKAFVETARNGPGRQSTSA